MSAPSPSELLAFLQVSEFLTASQSLQVADGGRPKFADARALARELVERDWLTAYQANQLLQGRGDDLLLGPYRILDRLGEGGMGHVFKARHVGMDRVVALKIIPEDRVSNPLALARFNREVRAVAKLAHPNIVTAFDVSRVGNTHFLAMEHVDGIDLARLVQQSGPLPVPNACEYIRQAAAGLQHAHEKGLVHRDIKPGNLMVARPNPDEPPIIKILDFGLARFESEASHDNRLTQLGKIVGTVDYIAPEQAMDARTADVRADIYSLGCSLFYVLTGKPPFAGQSAADKIIARVQGEAPSARAIRPAVSPALEAVLARMMARKPADRYHTPGEVVKALEPHTGKERPAVSIQNAATPAPAARSVEFQTAAPPRRAGGPVLRRRPLQRLPSNRIRLGIALGAAAAVLAVLVGVIVVVANPGAGDDKSGISNPRADGSPDGKPPKANELTNSIGMKLVLIPAGKFIMGSPQREEGRYDNEGPQHEVEISRPIYMGAYPVTKGQFAAFVEAKQYKTEPESDGKGGRGYNAATRTLEQDPKYTWKHTGFAQSDDHPVVNLTWNDATAFCDWLSKREGKTYSLPTEAEWEYACRAGTKTRFWCGDADASLKGNANVPDASLKGKLDADYAKPYSFVSWDDSFPFTSPVGRFNPNPWGLYDMSGNVWQWCSDWIGPMPGGPLKDPTGPESGPGRVLRGGTWLDELRYCRSANRYSEPPGVRFDNIGFRVVLRHQLPAK
jgi:formylglycine-generating enzyme required for sulfatase activity/tRNA A-37 threonylcarbamoyl transferase component Bud32